MPVIQVPIVVNTGKAEVLVVTEIPLAPAAFEIKIIEKKVIIDDCEVIPDKVIINGTLHKNIVYETKESTTTCEKKIRRVCGNVRHCTVDIPFSLFVRVPGAKEGDVCQVLDAFVEGERDELKDTTKDGTFETLLEKAVVRVDVKVVRTDHIDIDKPNGCAVKRQPEEEGEEGE